MEDRRFYVYEWYVIDTNEVFYVGKGTGDRYKRLRGRNYFFQCMYNSHNCDVRKIYENLTEDEAFKKEIEVIKYYKENTSHRLTNQTDGGEGVSGWVPTEEFRNKMSEIVKGSNNPNYQNYWSEEQKEYLRQKQKNNPLYKDESNPNAKQIICIETGEIFECIKFAREKYKIKSEGSVTVALKNPIRTAGGVHWAVCSDEFLDSNYRFNYLIDVLKRNTTNKSLICLEDLSLYNSKTNLARHLNITVSKITWQLNKEQKFTYKNKTYILIKNYEVALCSDT